MVDESKWRQEDSINFITKNWLIIVTLASCLITYTTLAATVRYQGCQIEEIQNNGSPAVRGMQKDIRWIMEVMACKWGLVVPKNEVDK